MSEDMQRLIVVRDAAQFLLSLKDGPRDDYYAATKDHAWQVLRDALADRSPGQDEIEDGAA